MFKDTL